MNKQLDTQLRLAKQASMEVAKLSAEKKIAALMALADCLQEHKKEIFATNIHDVAKTKKKGATNAFIDRMTFTETGFVGMIHQLHVIAHLPDSTGEIIEQRKLHSGIMLKKIRFPLGVIAMIYESRPNLTIDTSALCLKSGNAVILKGGSEAINTNRVLIACIHKTLRALGITEAAVTFLDTATHETVAEMLTRKDSIDVVIPRGSYALTTAVAEKSRIPILYHVAGGARMYVDKSANIQEALNICVNSKTNRYGVCNALDVVLVHEDIAEVFLRLLDEELTKRNVQIRADTIARRYMRHGKAAKKEDFETEFLDSIIAVKVVATADEGIDFIKTYTRGHTEVIAAEDKKVIDAFIANIDAAVLMINCSSRFDDGAEFGMGAEMGTATGKLHARGPVGIRELTTYKWIAFGNGQVKQ